MIVYSTVRLNFLLAYFDHVSIHACECLVNSILVSWPQNSKGSGKMTDGTSAGLILASDLSAELQKKKKLEQAK